MVDMCREKKTGMVEECRQSDGKRAMTDNRMPVQNLETFQRLAAMEMTNRQLSHNA